MIEDQKIAEKALSNPHIRGGGQFLLKKSWKIKDFLMISIIIYMWEAPRESIK
jgi:hypothetical protein